MESNQILLAWAASLESVRWVSAITQPSTVWASGTQWLRDWLTARLGLVANIELPPGVFAPSTSIAGNFILLGAHGDSAYFDSLTNPGDLVGLNDSNWFVGFEAWLRGEPATPGYEKPSASLESWAVRANDPQAEQTRERLANLGETVLLGDIRRVQDLDKPRRQTRFNLRCLRLVGDHPGFQQEDVKWHEALTRHDLYVEADKRFWVPLFPFVQVLTCPKCKSEETYYIDKWDSDRGIATMKSFERGHTEESSETATELHARPSA